MPQTAYPIVLAPRRPGPCRARHHLSPALLTGDQRADLALLAGDRPRAGVLLTASDLAGARTEAEHARRLADEVGAHRSPAMRWSSSGAAAASTTWPARRRLRRGAAPGHARRAAAEAAAATARTRHHRPGRHGGVTRLIAAPPNVAVRRHLPHNLVLPSTTAVISHSGLSTITAPLAEALPLLCIPQGRDQHSNAARVEASGTGPTLPPMRQATSSRPPPTRAQR